MNISLIRSLFPVTQSAVYLNNASQSPLNTLVHDRLQQHIKAELHPIGKKAFDRHQVRSLLSKLLGGAPEEYALVPSTGVGIGLVAQGLQLKKGDNIIIPEREHWNNIFPWLHLAEKGIEIRVATVNADNRLEPEAIEALIDKNTRVVSVAAVRFNSGFRPNLAAIGKVAHAHGALFMVDAAQGAGMIPIDVEKEQIDIMAGCGFKWLMGMQGTGFLYVSNRVIEQIEPVLPGMFAGENSYTALTYFKDARKFETGTLAYGLFNAWMAGLELLLEIGIDAIYERVLELTDVLIAGLVAQGHTIVTPITNRAERTAIVHFNLGDPETTKAIYQQLIAANILVTLQGENIRVSPNFFNTKEEIEVFLNAVGR